MKYALIRVSTGVCIYGKRLVDLPGALPIPGLDPDLKWCEMIFSDYPKIDVLKEGVTYKEELKNNKFYVTYESFLLSGGVKKPVTVPRGN